VEYPAPSVVDGCDPDPLVVCEPPSGTSLPLGAHVITCTAVDASGNESSCDGASSVRELRQGGSAHRQRNEGQLGSEERSPDACHRRCDGPNQTCASLSHLVLPAPSVPLAAYHRHGVGKKRHLSRTLHSH
jgi:hypothetical protein